MAEVSNLPVFHQQPNVQQQEQQRSYVQTLDSMASWSNINNSDDGDLHDFDFDPLSPPNLSFFMPSSAYPHNFNSNSDSDSDSESDYSHSVTDPNCFYGEDHMNFVTDLFESCEEHAVDDSDSVSEPFLDSLNNDINFRVFAGSAYDDFGPNHAEELLLGLGSGTEFDRVAFALDSRGTSTIRGAESGANGLRVVGFESDSDSEEVEVNSGVDDDGTSRVADSDLPIFWDCLRFDEQLAANEEFEWEEVDGRVDEREGLSSVIDRIEEISVSSEASASASASEEDAGDTGEHAVRNLEWEVLLAVNNLQRNFEFDNDGDDDGVSYLAVQDDYIYDTEYDALFGQFVERESALKGSPPAAKSVVENLPSVVLTKEDLRENNVICAVCKDEILVEERVTRLPCRHHYHGDCILPWLGIRNTCPVCRYELPTDDADYEQRKNRSDGLGLLDDLQVRYNFELVP